MGISAPQANPIERSLIRGAHVRSSVHRFVCALALAIAFGALAIPSNATPQTVQRSDKGGGGDRPYEGYYDDDYAGPSAGIILRRDGSQAVPFVADVRPEATATGDGFDWGDAGIGATAMLAIAAGAGLVFGRRPSRGPRIASRTATPTPGGRG